jgi:ATP-dependent RNA helicase DHX29
VGSTDSQHPSSINFRTSKADYGSNYLVYFTIMQSKKLYAWETGPVDDRALALFCGDNPDFKVRHFVFFVVMLT